VSTSGTDSDFVVKLIDVYPGDYPDVHPPQEPANTIKLGGYQQLVRGEPFRGKFRKGFEKPVPFEPGKPDRITFRLPDVAHTFREGHRIMVQIQSSWFPLTDRNPQKFMDIPKALSTDFVKATERVYFGGPDGSIRKIFRKPEADPDDPYALVGAPKKPRTPLRSAAAAVEPEVARR
jgi:predicted acyl esterase